MTIDDYDVGDVVIVWEPSILAQHLANRRDCCHVFGDCYLCRQARYLEVIA